MTMPSPYESYCQDCGANIATSGCYQYQSGDYIEVPHPFVPNKKVKAPVLRFVCRFCYEAWDKPDTQSDEEEYLDAGVEVILRSGIPFIVLGRTWIESDVLSIGTEITFTCEYAGTAIGFYIPKANFLHRILPKQIVPGESFTVRVGN